MYANFVIQQSAFDFHKTALQFIEYHVDPLYGKDVLATNRQLRSYMKERSFGSIHTVDYDLIVEVKEGKVERLHESATVKVNDVEVVEINIEKKRHADNIDSHYDETEPAFVIGSIQGAFERHNALVLNGEHKSALSSLLPLLRVISTKAVSCYVNKGEVLHSWYFVLADDEEYVNVITIDLDRAAVYTAK